MNWCMRHASSWIVAGLVLCASAGTAFAQDAPAPAGDGISVAGSGEAKGKPTAVQVSATVSGDAELAADAIVEYRDTKRRALEALEGLKLDGLKVESGGFAISQGVDAAQQMAMMNGNPMAGGPKQRVTVTEQITVVLGGLDKLKDEELMDTVLKVLDTGRDGGLRIGPPQPRNQYEMQVYYNNGRDDGNLVAFVIPDPESLRERAYSAAMADARRRGERLAALAGVKLGRIISVRDQGSAVVPMPGVAGQPGGEAGQLTSSVFSEIPIRVNLSVQFAIAGPADAAPAAGAGAREAAGDVGQRPAVAEADRKPVERSKDK